MPTFLPLQTSARALCFPRRAGGWRRLPVRQTQPMPYEMGDEGKAAKRGALAALLFERRCRSPLRRKHVGQTHFVLRRPTRLVAKPLLSRRWWDDNSIRV
jgi:hypothetical protein